VSRGVTRVNARSENAP